MTRIITTTCLIWLGLGGGVARATGLGVGICVPELPFSGAEQRHQMARKVAQHLSRALGRPVEGYAYLNPQDLRRDIRAGKLHFAIVGPLFASTMPEDQILAQARLDTEEATHWSVLGRTKQPLTALKGARLQLPRLGPSTYKFVQDGVLGDSLKVATNFRLQWSPDLLSAVKAVQLGRADAVVAPVSVHGLVPLVPGYRVPPPAFVYLDRQMPREMVARAQKAILSYGASIATVRDWHSAAKGAYRGLVAFSGRKGFRMVLIPRKETTLDVSALVNKDALVPGMPTLDSLFRVP